MKITKYPVHGKYGKGSCSSCKKGTLKKDGFGLEYPYDNIVEITLSNQSFRLCEECFNKLKTINYTDVIICNDHIDDNHITIK